MRPVVPGSFPSLVAEAHLSPHISPKRREVEQTGFAWPIGHDLVNCRSGFGDVSLTLPALPLESILV